MWINNGGLIALCWWMIVTFKAVGCLRWLASILSQLQNAAVIQRTNEELTDYQNESIELKSDSGLQWWTSLQLANCWHCQNSTEFWFVWNISYILCDSFAASKCRDGNRTTFQGVLMVGRRLGCPGNFACSPTHWVDFVWRRYRRVIKELYSLEKLDGCSSSRWETSIECGPRPKGYQSCFCLRYVFYVHWPFVPCGRPSINSEICRKSSSWCCIVCAIWFARQHNFVSARWHANACLQCCS